MTRIWCAASSTDRPSQAQLPLALRQRDFILGRPISGRTIVKPHEYPLGMTKARLDDCADVALLSMRHEVLAGR